MPLFNYGKADELARYEQDELLLWSNDTTRSRGGLACLMPFTAKLSVENPGRGQARVLFYCEQTKRGVIPLPLGDPPIRGGVYGDEHI